MVVAFLGTAEANSLTNYNGTPTPNIEILQPIFSALQLPSFEADFKYFLFLTFSPQGLCS
jgi:hypothetical protein